jgi:hypothetical protein
MVVEQIGNKRQVQFVNPIHYIIWCHKASATQFGSLLQHYFSSVQLILFLNTAMSI